MQTKIHEKTVQFHISCESLRAIYMPTSEQRNLRSVSVLNDKEGSILSTQHNNQLISLYQSFRFQYA